VDRRASCVVQRRVAGIREQGLTNDWEVDRKLVGNSGSLRGSLAPTPLSVGLARIGPTHAADRHPRRLHSGQLVGLSVSPYVGIAIARAA